MTTNKCITCQTNPINPMITDSDSVPGKSFCSRVCQSLYLRPDMQWINMNTLRLIALSQLARLDGNDGTNTR